MAGDELAGGSSQPLTKHVSGDGTSTLTYTLPAGVYQYVQSVNAVIDTSASGDVQPVLTVREADQTVIADKQQDDAIDGGGSGRATWALRLAGSVAGAIRFNRVNTGRWLEIDVTGGSPTTFLGFVVKVKPSVGGGFTITSSENANEQYSFGGGASWDTAGNGIVISTQDAGGNGGFSLACGAVVVDAESVDVGASVGSVSFGAADSINLGAVGGEDVNVNAAGGRLGFFGTGPVAQQGTPVTLGDVIALLRAYGLAA